MPTKDASCSYLVPVQKSPLPSHTQSDTGIQLLCTFSEVRIHMDTLLTVCGLNFKYFYASFSCIATPLFPADIPASPVKLSPSGEYMYSCCLILLSVSNELDCKIVCRECAWPDMSHYKIINHGQALQWVNE